MNLPWQAVTMAVYINHRILSENTFTESISKLANRASVSRNTAIKGVEILLKLNILTRTKRAAAERKSKVSSQKSKVNAIQF